VQERMRAEHARIRSQQNMRCRIRSAHDPHARVIAETP
jgi:hypothetical protein